MAPANRVIRLRRLLFQSLQSSCTFQLKKHHTLTTMPKILNNDKMVVPIRKSPIRLLQTVSTESFKASDVVVQTLPVDLQAEKPAWNKLLFGHHVTDHMIKIRWTSNNGWDVPTIVPVQNFSLHPYAKVFHYAQELFEGMKAYRGNDNKIRLFRPDMNMKRMKMSAARLCLPDFDGDELIELIKHLLRIDESWVPPYESNASMYIRPTLMGIEPTLGVSPSNEAILFVVMGPVGPYFSTGQLKPVSLLATTKFVRAWPGGSGDRKLGANYAPTLLAQKEAAASGQQQVLWLHGPDYLLTEVGTMNIFMLSRRTDGTVELATPPLEDGLILPGVTRDSLLALTRSWAEFEVVERTISMAEVDQLINEGRMLEMFGAGTACVVCPIGEIHFKEKVFHIPEPKLAGRLLKDLTDMQYGLTPHPWSVLV